MSETKTIPAKYIFLDVVSFTHNRSVEAQTEIVHSLNQIVTNILTELEVDKDRVIFLPTGDGICIALLNIEDPFDIHLQIALKIIGWLNDINKAAENEMRKFEVRIGINANIDNLVTDINGKQNLAGAGINMAARVMSKADGNQVLVGESVYDTLRYREKYMKAFKGFDAEVKHGVQMRVYQYTLNDVEGLNTKIPESLKRLEKPDKPIEKFPINIAYYLAFLIQNKDSFIKHKENPGYQLRLKVVCWLNSKDLVRKVKALETEAPQFLTHKFGQATIDEQTKYYSQIDIYFLLAFKNEIDKELSMWSCYFYGYVDYIFVNKEGIEKLKLEREEIWKEFELEKYI